MFAATAFPGLVQIASATRHLVEVGVRRNLFPCRTHTLDQCMPPSREARSEARPLRAKLPQPRRSAQRRGAARQPVTHLRRRVRLESNPRPHFAPPACKRLRALGQVRFVARQPGRFCFEDLCVGAQHRGGRYPVGLVAQAVGNHVGIRKCTVQLGRVTFRNRLGLLLDLRPQAVAKLAHLAQVGFARGRPDLLLGTQLLPVVALPALELAAATGKLPGFRNQRVHLPGEAINRFR